MSAGGGGQVLPSWTEAWNRPCVWGIRGAHEEREGHSAPASLPCPGDSVRLQVSLSFSKGRL